MKRSTLPSTPQSLKPVSSFTNSVSVGNCEWVQGLGVWVDGYEFRERPTLESALGRISCLLLNGICIRGQLQVGSGIKDLGWV